MVSPLVVVRLLAPQLEGLAVLAGLAGAVGGTVVLVAAGRRNRHVREVLTCRADTSELPGAGLLLLLAAMLMVGGLATAGLVLAFAR